VVVDAVRRTLPGHGHPARLEVTADGQRLLSRAREAVAALDRTVLASVPTDHLDGIRGALLELVMGRSSPVDGAGPPGPPGL
jgi:hypothetical protein